METTGRPKASLSVSQITICAHAMHPRGHEDQPHAFGAAAGLADNPHGESSQILTVTRFFVLRLEAGSLAHPLAESHALLAGRFVIPFT